MPNEQRQPGLMSRLGNAVRTNLTDWRQVVDMITEPWAPGNWYDPATRRLNGPVRAFGLDRIPRFFGGLMNRSQPLPSWMNYPSAGPQPPAAYNGPGSPGYQPDIPAVPESERSPFRGEGALASYGNPTPTHGTRNGRWGTLAEGQAARDMFQSMQEAYLREQDTAARRDWANRQQ